MKTARKILHMDLDAFFCAVEELADPSLRGKPFAVGGSPDGRGVVCSCSYPARRYGVRSGMAMAHAIRLCPNLCVVSSRHGKYGSCSREVMRILWDTTPLVEQISIDEAFLDVTDLSGDLAVIARSIQSRIRETTNLPSSFGGAANLLIAKIANNVGKKSTRGWDYPRAVFTVDPGTEKAFLAPMKTSALWGIGEKTETALRNMGIFTIGQLAAVPEQTLFRRFGKYGLDLHEHANGIDHRQVNPVSEDPKSVSQENTFDVDISDFNLLTRQLRSQSDQVGFRLRKAGLAGNTVKIKIRWANFSTIVRQMKVDPPINQDGAIFDAALGLLREVWKTTRDPVRLIGVGVSGFACGADQLTFIAPPETLIKEGELLKAVDQIRIKYGKNSLRRAGDMVPERTLTPENEVDF